MVVFAPSPCKGEGKAVCQHGTNGRGSDPLPIRIVAHSELPSPLQGEGAAMTAVPSDALRLIHKAIATLHRLPREPPLPPQLFQLQHDLTAIVAAQCGHQVLEI